MDPDKCEICGAQTTAIKGICTSHFLANLDQWQAKSKEARIMVGAVGSMDPDRLADLRKRAAEARAYRQTPEYQAAMEAIGKDLRGE